MNVYKPICNTEEIARKVYNCVKQVIEDHQFDIIIERFDKEIQLTAPYYTDDMLYLIAYIDGAIDILEDY